eukprot:Gb_01412 [translate_table: standard]
MSDGCGELPHFATHNIPADAVMKCMDLICKHLRENNEQCTSARVQRYRAKPEGPALWLQTPKVTEALTTHFAGIHGVGLTDSHCSHVQRPDYMNMHNNVDYHRASHSDVQISGLGIKRWSIF